MGGTEINKHGKYWVNGGDVFDNNRHRAYCLSASTKYFCVKGQEHILRLRVFPQGSLIPHQSPYTFSKKYQILRESPS